MVFLGAGGGRAQDTELGLLWGVGGGVAVAVLRMGSGEWRVESDWRAEKVVVRDVMFSKCLCMTK